MSITRNQRLALLVFLVMTFAAGAIGSLATTPSIGGWYRTLVKPAGNPPNWIFGPVWTTLYLLMAYAAWRVWLGRGVRGARWALGLFILQLTLNSLWSILFFGLHRPAAAFFELLLLWCVILATLVAFWRHSRTAGLLLVPYLLWVAYAGYLNHALWRLNS